MSGSALFAGSRWIAWYWYTGCINNKRLRRVAP
jgi:hypothetical protein